MKIVVKGKACKYCGVVYLQHKNTCVFCKKKLTGYYFPGLEVEE